MSESCIFCKIVSGKIPAYKVYEDNNTLAFLDINPLSKGHTLVIPKMHVRQIEELSEKELEILFKTVWKLTKYVQIATGTASSLIGINNGPESGQEIPHIHVHIIPRSKGDGGGPIHSAMRNRPTVSKEEMQKIVESIISVLK
ncbi:MAG: HIT family protein [Thaumarchaeota archaeon]|nr:HIT family protein [Nitrososphaerota archaeon]